MQNHRRTIHANVRSHNEANVQQLGARARFAGPETSRNDMYDGHNLKLAPRDRVAAKLERTWRNVHGKFQDPTKAHTEMGGRGKQKWKQSRGAGKFHSAATYSKQQI